MEHSKGYDIKLLTDYLDKNNADYTIDENPSTAKLKKIKAAIKRKEAFIQNSIKIYSNRLARD